MKGKIGRSIFFLISISAFSCVCLAEDWIKVKEGILEDDLYSICIHPLDEKIIYCGSDNAIYKSQDFGKTWQSIYTIRGESNKVNFIFCDLFSFNTLYIALDKGLFRSNDSGKNFQRIFQKSSEKVLYVTKNKSEIYLATDIGLYVSTEDMWQWQKISGLPQDTAVRQVIFSPKDIVFIIADSGLYRSKDNLKKIERIFVVGSKETTEFADEYFVEEEETYRDIPKVIFIDEEDSSKIYLGTNKGLFISEDGGETFVKKILPNLGELEIRWIEEDIQNSKILYLATNRGFFKLDLSQEIALNLYQGLITKNIRFFQQDSSGKFWLATDKGLYVSNSVSSESSFVLDNPNFEEPTIREIQEAALSYNEVHPEKIKAWRNSLRYRALFPDISLNYDKTVYGSSSGQFAVGPRDWGVAFSWDVGDIIWNSYQDDVDTRSRLNTQLRIDILEEVNRIYFERKRLKRLIEITPPKDEKEKIERGLRLEELTSLLDGYTGGTFSKRMRK